MGWLTRWKSTKELKRRGCLGGPDLLLEDVRSLWFKFFYLDMDFAELERQHITPEFREFIRTRHKTISTIRDEFEALRDRPWDVRAHSTAPPDWTRDQEVRALRARWKEGPTRHSSGGEKQAGKADGKTR